MAANLSGREGYPLPFVHTATDLDGLTRNIQVNGVDDVRTDDVVSMDLRVEKDFVFGNDVCALPL